MKWYRVLCQASVVRGAIESFHFRTGVSDKETEVMESQHEQRTKDKPGGFTGCSPHVGTANAPTVAIAE